MVPHIPALFLAYDPVCIVASMEDLALLQASAHEALQKLRHHAQRRIVGQAAMPA